MARAFHPDSRPAVALVTGGPEHWALGFVAGHLDRIGFVVERWAAVGETTRSHPPWLPAPAFAVLGGLAPLPLLEAAAQLKETYRGIPVALTPDALFGDTLRASLRSGLVDVVITDGAANLIGGWMVWRAMAVLLGVDVRA